MTIEELNQSVKNCSQCSLSETRTNAVCGEGNLYARIMLIAQAPGITEDREDKMFTGPSGVVLDELLGNAGVGREEIYMTNLVKCMLPKNRRPKQKETETCTTFLKEEIRIINPYILIPLGYYASKYILKEYALLDPERHDLNKIYGKIFYNGIKKVFPLHHPAAILHNSLYREGISRRYLKMKVLNRDCKWYQVCPMKRFTDEGKLSRKWVELYCRGDWESCIRYQLEERGEYHPDCMLPDGSIDKKLLRC